MEVKDEVNAYWSMRAEEYADARYREYGSQTGQQWKTVLEQYVPSGSFKALDVGTGGGLFAMLMQDLGGEVTAVDYSQEMLKYAARNMKMAGKSGIDFRKMDAMNLKLEDDSFDFIFTHNVTWTLSDPKKAYQEMLRVLKKGGRLVNVDACYAEVFRKMDKEGLTEKCAVEGLSKYAHPYQSLAMLKERNRLAESLYIADQPRPLWDVDVFLEAGVSGIEVIPDMEARYFGKKRQDPSFGNGQFLIAVVK